MSYELILGDPAYSSWSMRPWVLMDHYDIPMTLRWVSFSDDKSVNDQLGELPLARTVPVLVTDDAVIPDSMAIAEELAARHPDLPLWPTAPHHRALARSMVCEMHSSFAALREDCPMNLRCAYTSYTPSADVKKDVERIAQLWAHAQKESKIQDTWLFGDYGIIDAFFAPVAARFAGYGISLPSEAQAYVKAHLSHASFRKWREIGLKHGPDLPWYARNFAQGAWPD